jgi:murein DD-endopeptidase MepM/ murein hydrolase activator NlpD
LEKEGFTNAIDIMGAPGTPVLAPMQGTVLYFHPEGAQGGGSMEVKFADGRIGWIGHVDNGLPAGTKVGPGSQLAVISAHHARPHVHWDLRA